jgi:hypothetical protein
MLSHKILSLVPDELVMHVYRHYRPSSDVGQERSCTLTSFVLSGTMLWRYHNPQNCVLTTLGDIVVHRGWLDCITDMEI